MVLSSWIAFGPSRARYDRVGFVRVSGEKELILCNLLARRTTMLELGGFDESLYPNEENALMDELQERGGKLIYDPRIIAHRRPRPTLKAFCKMLMTYGRGRAEQFRLHPTPGSALNFVPPLFVAFLIVFVTAMIFLRNSIWLLPMYALLCFYGGTLVAQTLVSALKRGFLRGIAALPLLFVTHFLYGLGFWRGLFTRVNRSKPATTEVTFDRIQL